MAREKNKESKLTRCYLRHTREVNYGMKDRVYLWCWLFIKSDDFTAKVVKAKKKYRYIKKQLEDKIFYCYDNLKSVDNAWVLYDNEDKKGQFKFCAYTWDVYKEVFENGKKYVSKIKTSN